MERKDDRQPLGLYVHVPFCVKKCDYCDFLSFSDQGIASLGMEGASHRCGSSAEWVKERYVAALEEELEQVLSDQTFCSAYKLDTVFVGGGTPSSLSFSLMERLCRLVERTIAALGNRQGGLEVTVECNPGTLTWEKLCLMGETGVNRLSLGLQSANDQELKRLGRIHDYESFLESYELARKAGFSNVNVDLMCALPGQTLESHREGLQKVLALRPEHVSAYSLIIEEGTKFAALYGEDDERRQRGKRPIHLPDEETERQMYEETERLLTEQGYSRYEISNYAREGMECRHNVGYWTGKAYLGIGLGAASYLWREGEEQSHVRFSRTSCLSEYLEGDFSRRQEQWLTRAQRMEEFLFLGLRRRQGISEKEFRRRFHVELEEPYGAVLAQLQKDGLIARTEEGIALTPFGTDVSNYVFERFLDPGEGI